MAEQPLEVVRNITLNTHREREREEGRERERGRERGRVS